MPYIAVIGSANADLVVEVERRPLGGETLSGSELAVAAGGKGANQAAAAARLGAAVAMVGCVGTDPYGDVLVDALGEAGVDVDTVARVERGTSVALITLTPDGENSIIVAAGANDEVTPEYLASVGPSWQKAALVVAQLEVPMPTIDFLAAQCAERGVRLLLNAAPARPLTAEVLSWCDPLVVNESEAGLLVGQGASPDPSVLLRQVASLGARSVVITLGAAGAVALDADGVELAVPAKKVSVVDTTGAGDAFVGGLAAVLVRGGSLAEGLALGTEAAAVAIQSKGAQPSYRGFSSLA